MSLIFTFIFLFLISLFMIIRKKKYPLDAFNMTIFLFAFLYVLIPEVLPCSYACEPFCDGVPWLVSFISIIGLGAFIFGFYLSNIFPVFKVTKSIIFSEKYQYRLSLFVIGLSFSFLYIYAQSFNGFLNAFSYGAIMRFTGEKNIDINASSAIVMYFISVTYIMFSILQYKLYIKTKYQRRYIFLMIVTVTIILSNSIISGSRGAIFQVFLISLFLYLNLYGMKINLRKVIIVIFVILVGLFFVSYGKSAIANVSKVFQGESISEATLNTESKSFEYIYGRLILEFSHSIKSLAIVMNHDIEFNGMNHFLNAPLDLIPTKLLGINIEKPTRIHEVNSELVVGDAEHGVPPGIIASFWYGGGIVSVFIGMFMSGIMIGWVQRQSYKIINTYPMFIPIMLYIFFKLAWFINNGDLSVFLKEQIHVLLFFIVLFLFLFLYSLYKLFFKDYILKKHTALERN